MLPHTAARGALRLPARGQDPFGCPGGPAAPAGHYDGTVALVRRGKCTFRTKADNLLGLGAGAMVVINSAGAPLFSMTVCPPPLHRSDYLLNRHAFRRRCQDDSEGSELDFPSVLVSKAVGDELEELIRGLQRNHTLRQVRHRLVSCDEAGFDTGCG